MPEEVSIPRLVVAGISSGSGKTSITLGLVAALRSRGRTVQTFKVGPDFNDCAYLARASRRPCRNLDSWILGTDGVRRSLAHGVVGADAVVVEGVMGIYDGHGMAGESTAAGTFPGSTAEVARLIRAPIVLVLDAWSTGETAAALALGVKQLDLSGSVIGVILNSVPSDHRRQVIEDAVWTMARLPVLGAVPRIEAAHIPELRSGLLPLTQNPHVDDAIAQLSRAVERHCDVDLIERLMARSQTLPLAAPQRRAPATGGEAVRIGVAFDDAFCFYYAENLELLEAAGAEIITFSPLEDRALPRDIDFVYLGGGVSEAYIPRLAGNHSFLTSFKHAYAQGLAVYAECGGLQYCARTVRTSDGSINPMAGLLPVDLALEAGALHTGYRDLRVASASMLGPVGIRLRGHESHFARLLSGNEALSPAYTMHDSDGEPLGCEGWASSRLLASFVNLHFGQDAGLAPRLVAAARSAAARRRGLQAELAGTRALASPER